MRLGAVLCFLCAVAYVPVSGAEVQPQALSVVADTYAARLNEPVRVHVFPSEDLDSAWHYEWSAQRGTITGTGPSAVYTAGATVNPGYDVISVTVSNTGGAPVTRHAVIYVYKQFVVLKADDLVCWGYLDNNWKYYIDYLTQRHIKTSVGIITRFIDPAWNKYLGYADFIQFIQENHASGHVEFWNHGYDHLSGPGWYEFSGTDAAYQQLHFEGGQALARQMLGFSFTAFDASFNTSDSTTTSLVNTSADTEVWMFGPASGSSKPVLGRAGGEIESSAGVPSWSQFQSSYGTHNAVVVLQHHPARQTFRDGFAQFEQIIDFLSASHVTFIQPTEYARLVQQGIMPLEPEADTDQDGLTDRMEGHRDTNGDGLPDFLDPSAPPSLAPESLCVKANAVAVRAGKSVSLSVQPEAGLGGTWSYQWRAERGTVTPIGNGSQAKYTAPASLNPGFEIVTVSISKNGQLLVERSATLMLYNQFVMLKADDWDRLWWKSNGIGDAWPYYVNYLAGRNIKSNLGLVAIALDVNHPYTPVPPNDNKLSAYVDYTCSVRDMGLFEFFCHGYDHAQGTGWWEFCNTSYEHQSGHLTRAQNAVQQFIGIPLHSFAAPFNAWDATTTASIEANPDINVWVYGDKANCSKVVLERRGPEIEKYSTGIPTYQGFVSGYTDQIDRMVLQHHPNYDGFLQHFSEFDAILNFLVERRVTFVTFNEYHELVEHGMFPFELGVDTDGDGVPDTVEGNGDADKDGILDFADEDTAPVITVQPVGGQIASGEAFQFRVEATGSSPLHYQWFKDGLPIAGAIFAEYVIEAATLLDSGLYTVRISNRVGEYLGNAVSEGASLVVGVKTDVTKPVITLLGLSTVTVAKDTAYIDPGATAYDAIDGDITQYIVVTGAVNTGTIGTYSLSYNVSDAAGNAADTAVRTVHVADGVKPTITLLGNAVITVAADSPYEDPGAIAIDDVDGDLSGDVVVTGTVNTGIPGAYVLLYGVADSAGNAADSVVRVVYVQPRGLEVKLDGESEVTIQAGDPFADPGVLFATSTPGTYTITYMSTGPSEVVAVPITRTVHVVDNMPPEIKLLGAETNTIPLGAVYSDPGATAFDASDGNVTGSVTVSGYVNTAVPGVYTVTYHATDSSGNVAVPAVRTVTVTTP